MKTFLLKKIQSLKQTRLSISAIIVVFNIMCLSAYAQDFSSLKHIGGTGNVMGGQPIEDNLGNIIYSGSFAGVCDFDMGAGNFPLTASGYLNNIFISKISADGAFQWAITYDFIISGFSKCCDSAGNLYIFGTFSGNFDFDPSPTSIFLMNSSSQNGSLFCSKLDNNGKFLWAKTIGKSTGLKLTGFDFDGVNNFYLSGEFSDSLFINDLQIPINFKAFGSNDGFILKLDTNLSVKMGVKYSNPLSAIYYGPSIMVTKNNEFYTYGRLNGTYIFDENHPEFSLKNSGSSDAFLCKHSSDGTVAWTKKFTTKSNLNLKDLISFNNGDLYLTGNYRDTINFDGHKFVPPSGTFAGFLVKYSTNGEYKWLKEFKSAGNNFSGNITVENDYNIIITGTFSGNFDLDPGPGSFLITSGQYNSSSFLVKLDSSGNFAWGGQIKGNPHTSSGRCLVSREGEILFFGSFIGTTDFDIETNIYNQTSHSGYYDVFFLKLTQDLCSNIRLKVNKYESVDCYKKGVLSLSVLGATPPVIGSWDTQLEKNGDNFLFPNSGIYTYSIADTVNCKKDFAFLIEGAKYYNNYDLLGTLSTGSFRINSNSKIKLIAQNSSCIDTTVELKLILSPLVNYNNANPTPDLILGDTLIWNLANLHYLSTPFAPQVNVTTSNAAQIGDTIHLRTIITPITGDADTTNNIKDYYYPVINGYDPNDIQVNPRGNCAKNYISNNQTLTYTVRFQNTGNAEAINIAVLDSLSSNLDVNTLRVLASSDTMYTMILPNNVVKFMFDSIMLADSNSNEPASHGYVVFEIKPKANLSNETKIENRADIYFDFNPAVLTNTVFNTITDGSAYPCILTSVENIETKNNTLYPNPSSGIFNLTSSSIAQNITVYDQTGRTIMNIIPTQNTTSIDLSSVSNGMYFIQVKSNESVQVLKAVVQK